MKKFYNSKKIKFNKNILIIILVVIYDIILFNLFGNNLSDNISYMTKVKVEEISKYYMNNVIKKYLNINCNNYIKLNLVNNNIMSIDIDNNSSNELLNNIITDLEKVVSDIENGKINDYSNLEFLYGKNGIILLVPIGSALNNTLLYDIGPKIPVKISFLENINAYLDISVEEYGINNALVKLYININLEQHIEMPIDKEKNTINYKFLIASKLVNGKVPDFYNGMNGTSSIVNSNVK